MQSVSGTIVDGLGHWSRRIVDSPDVFEKATGEVLCPGTLNVKIDRKIPINEHFRVVGSEIHEPHENYIFEICRIGGIWAYRVRPLNLSNGKGGSGDDILEIACKVKLRDELHLITGSKVTIELFRLSLDFGYS